MARVLALHKDDDVVGHFSSGDALKGLKEFEDFRADNRASHVNKTLVLEMLNLNYTADIMRLTEEHLPGTSSDWSSNEIWAREILGLHILTAAMFPSSSTIDQQYRVLWETICWNPKRPVKPEVERERATLEKSATVGPQTKKRKLNAPRKVVSAAAVKSRTPRAGPHSVLRSRSGSRSRPPRHTVPDVTLRGEDVEQSDDLSWANKDTVGGFQDTSNMNHVSPSRYEIHNPTRYDDPATFRGHVRRAMCLQTMGLDLDRRVAVVNDTEIEVESSSRWKSFSRYTSGQSSFDVCFVAYTHALKGSNIFETMEESQKDKIKRLYSQTPQPQSPPDLGTTQSLRQFSQDLGSRIESIDPKLPWKRTSSMTNERSSDHYELKYMEDIVTRLKLITNKQKRLLKTGPLTCLQTFYNRKQALLRVLDITSWNLNSRDTKIYYGRRLSA
ncbi:hypothetical protein MMC27_001159 [Xylographa pallens]|nr:hypothetical protein [Xylographa pallens]